jgi:hypothetical protein
MRVMHRRLLVLLAFAAAFSVIISPAESGARPGGGQSFSTGSSSSSRSSSSSSYGGSSRSSSGSSWGSSGSSRSSSGSGSSLFGSGSSTRSPSTSTGSTYTGSSSYGSGTSSGNDYGSTPSSYVGPDRPLSRFFWIPCLILGVIAVGALVHHLQKKKEEEMWANVTAGIDRDAAMRAEQELAKRRYPTIAAALAGLRSQDENFSWTLFEDFLHALYVETQRLRGGGRLALLKPYLSDAARAAYDAYPADEVKAIIVGSLETQSITVDDAQRKISASIAFDVNYTEVGGGQENAFYAREIWTLARGADIASRPPKRARTLDCPNCGAPLEKLMGANCEYCGAPAAAGSRDWMVERISVENREIRGPMLTGTTEEQGTDLPTVVAPDVKQTYAELSQRDPAFDWGTFVKRVELVFQTFHRAWASQELGPVRPFLSDNLFETQTYWVAAYRAQNLRNITDEPQTMSVQLARLVHDKFYDAITVRVFAQCKDYTLDASGKIVGGSRENVRRYSEYWTFIRAATRAGAPGTEPKCPNCGAPTTEIDVAGNCQSCHVKVTSGEFDWTLSRIEQDEVYRL